MIRELGTYIVAEDGSFGGQPRFRGTRIPVSDVLSMLAEGMPRDEIVRNCDGRVSREAIAEAVELAAKALQEQQEAARASA